MTKERKQLYNSWRQIKYRCYNPKIKAYHWYGAKGVTMCQDWLNSFDSFMSWAENNGYKYGLSIDRMDCNGNYTPENCQWISRSEQTLTGKRGIFSNNKTGVNGVTFDNHINGFKRFRVTIMVNLKLIFIGRYYTLKEAANARILAEIKHYGKQMTNL